MQAYLLPQFVSLLLLQSTRLHTLFSTYTTKLQYIRAKCKKKKKLKYVPNTTLSLTIHFSLQYCLFTLKFVTGEAKIN